MPNPPATATSGLARASAIGVTMSPVGSTDGSRMITRGPRLRRIPMFHVAPVPSCALVVTISRSSVAPGSRAASSGERPSATMTMPVPEGAELRSPATARLTSSVEPVATMTTVATPTAGSSSRDGTSVLEP